MRGEGRGASEGEGRGASEGEGRGASEGEGRGAGAGEPPSKCIRFQNDLCPVILSYTHPQKVGVTGTITHGCVSSLCAGTPGVYKGHCV